jgi:hypothetical protein
MPQYLYIFGFNTPEQIKGFEKHGWDDEDSGAVFIEAVSEQEALTWGREISQEFVRRLYGDRGLIWRHADYAHWIETDPASRFSPEALRRLQVVQVGEHPALDRNRFADRPI